MAAIHAIFRNQVGYWRKEALCLESSTEPWSTRRILLLVLTLEDTPSLALASEQERGVHFLKKKLSLATIEAASFKIIRRIRS